MSINASTDGNQGWFSWWYKSDSQQGATAAASNERGWLSRFYSNDQPQATVSDNQQQSESWMTRRGSQIAFIALSGTAAVTATVLTGGAAALAMGTGVTITLTEGAVIAATSIGALVGAVPAGAEAGGVIHDVVTSDAEVPPTSNAKVPPAQNNRKIWFIATAGSAITTLGLAAMAFCTCDEEGLDDGYCQLPVALCATGVITTTSLGTIAAVKHIEK